jgi:hypothetical protein
MRSRSSIILSVWQLRPRAASS